MGLRVSKGGDVIAADLEAYGLFGRHRGGLMFFLLQHRSKAEEVAMDGLVDQDLLLILVGYGHVYLAGHDDVAVARRVAGFEDALARCEPRNLYLRCKYLRFVIVEKLEERYVPQFLRITWHGFVSFAGGSALICR